MKVCLLFLLAGTALMALILLAGPRQLLRSVSVQAPRLPEDLDGYFTEKESSVPELKEGTESRIVWYDPESRGKTEWAVVYLHGFTASSREISPVCEEIASGLKANLFFIRFRGHGTLSGRPLADVGPTDWFEDTLESLEVGTRIGDRILLMGASHGALLAFWAALHHPEYPISAIAVSAPNFAPADTRTRRLLWPWAKQVLPLFYGDRIVEPQNSSHAYFWNLNYPLKALFPMMAQVDYMHRQSLAPIELPVMVFYCPEDTTVQNSLIVQRFHELGSSTKELVCIPNPQDRKRHTLAGDILSPGTTRQMVDAVLDLVNRIPGH